jgi:hypothetical protein
MLRGWQLRASSITHPSFDIGEVGMRNVNRVSASVDRTVRVPPWALPISEAMWKAQTWPFVPNFAPGKRLKESVLYFSRDRRPGI